MASSLLRGGLAANDFICILRKKFTDFTSLSTSSSGDNNKSKPLKMNLVADAMEIAVPTVVPLEILTKQGHRDFGGTVNSSNSSGFVVTEDGMVLTNQHVVDKTSHLDIKLKSGETYKGVVVDVDEKKLLVNVGMLPQQSLTSFLKKIVK